MKTKRLLASTIAFVCVIVLAFIATGEPIHIVRGLLLNEAFYRGYPTGYWRELLGRDGRAGAVDINTALRLEDRRAVPVLLECLADSDPNVRWPSVILLERAGSVREVEPAFRRALDDADLDVRYQAIRALGRLRRGAMPSVPKLVELSRHDDVGIAVAALYALWEIDPETASTVGDWQEFTSAKWEFSVTLPGPPEEKESFTDTPYGQVPMHMFGASYGVARCLVSVFEYSPEMLEDCPLQERFDSSAEETATMYGGSLVSYDPTEQHGYSGREKVVEVAGRGTIRSRIFPVGQRAYHISITSPPGDFTSPKAEEFFLGSLRITYSPEPVAETGNPGS